MTFLVHSPQNPIFAKTHNHDRKFRPHPRHLNADNGSHSSLLAMVLIHPSPKKDGPQERS